MTSDKSLNLDPYEAVLADLRVKRDQLDQTIKLLEAQKAGVTAVTASDQKDAPAAGAFLGMTIAEATKKLLATRKQPLGSSEILAGLKAGGLVMSANNPINIIGSVLYRRFTDKGDIVRIGRGTWGLPEWYPNRSFKKKDKEGDEATNEAETSEPEQPSQPKLFVAKR